MVFQTGTQSPGGGHIPSGPQSKATTDALKRLTTRNAGVDISAMTQAPGFNGYQDALPDLDLRTTWGPSPSPNDPSILQQGIALTIRSMRAGLNLQRDLVSVAHARMTEGTMTTHFRDEGILSFEIEKQLTVPSTIQPQNPRSRGFIHCTYQGRKVMTRLGNDFETPTGLYIFVETSINDPTIIKKTVVTGASQFGATCMGTIRYNSGLVVCIMAFSGSGYNAYLISNLDNPSSGLVTVPLVANQAFLGDPDTNLTYTPGAFIQSGLPGNPLIVKSLNSVYLQPVEADADWPGLTWGPATIDAAHMQGGTNLPLALMSVSGRKPKAYFLASYDGVVFQLDSVDALGTTLETISLSVNPLWGAAAIPARGLIALNGGSRVVLWDGREKETGLFADERPPAGYQLFCTGLWVDNGVIFACVDELPSPDDPNPYPSLGDSIGRGRIRNQIRRYDFELQRWHPLSDWTVYTEDGLVVWSQFDGLPVPTVSTVDGHYGYSSSMGLPDLPFGEVTRAMHNYVQSAVIGTVPDPATVANWARKFEPYPGINPYAYNGLRPHATGAISRSPGYLFTGDAMLADKYLDGVEWNGIDSGGAGSQVKIRMAEFGHLDDTGLPAAVFSNGLSHPQRRRPYPDNKTSFQIPQIEVEIVGGSDDTLTPQVFPFTLYMHIDMPIMEHPDSYAFGRASSA